ncbi:MAG: hypothetical protein A2X12_02610 [Bacteroidetes bacterium GWE2_29_8]|nr:MAG: hypothetical protein A2X12_02610 [Bacteroidetes bacterium GWE2_29_8]OFY22215.1 MAG: hypothetical protein A2X02_00110 [Bacteroidetes bacterium GWF2_29_10]
MKVNILTENNYNHSINNLTRSIAYYQMFESINADVNVYVEGEKNCSEILEVNNVNFEYKNWHSKYSSVKESDIIVIDSNKASIDLYNKFRKKAKTPIFIDDALRLKYPKGIVINGMIDIDKFSINQKSKSKYLLGIEYHLLQKPFWEREQKILKIEIENILVSLCTNNNKLTYNIIKELAEVFPYINIHVILPYFCNDNNQHENYQFKNIRYYKIINAKQYKNLINKCDIAISGGGETLYELTSSYIPIIAILETEEQYVNINGFSKRVMIDYVKKTDNQLITNIILSVKKFDNIIERIQLIENQKKFHQLTCSKEKILEEILQYNN